MGFITKQIKNDLISGVNTPLMYKKEKTEEELVIDEITARLISLFKSKLIQYEFIDIEHLRKASASALDSINAEIDKSYTFGEPTKWGRS